MFLKIFLCVVINGWDNQECQVMWLDSSQSNYPTSEEKKIWHFLKLHLVIPKRWFCRWDDLALASPVCPSKCRDQLPASEEIITSDQWPLHFLSFLTKEHHCFNESWKIWLLDLALRTLECMGERFKKTFQNAIPSNNMAPLQHLKFVCSNICNKTVSSKS